MALVDNVVAHYRFNSDGSDAHDSLDLTLVNSPTFPSGKIGNAMSLVPASSQYAYNSDATSWNSVFGGTTEWTIGVWVYLDFTGLTYFVTGRWNASNSYKQVGLDVTASGNAFRLYVRSASTTYTATGPAASSGSWYHLIAYRNTSTNQIVLRVNDSADYTQTVPGTAVLQSPSSASFLGVGANSNPGSYWPGDIDSLTFWSRRISSSEITEHYNSGAGVDYPFATGDQTINVLPVDSLFGLFAPTVIADQVVTPAVLNSLFALLGPTVVADQFVSPAALNSLFVVPASDITGDVTLTPAALASLAVALDAGVLADQLLTPGSLASLVTVLGGSVLAEGLESSLELSEAIVTTIELAIQAGATITVTDLLNASVAQARAHTVIELSDSLAATIEEG